MNVEDLWKRLETEGVEKSGYVRLRLPQIEVCPVYAARRIETGLEAVVLEVDKAALQPGTEYPHTRGFEVRAESVDVGRTGRVRILLSLVEQRYRDVFASLAHDVVGQLKGCADEHEVVGELISRLLRWQIFLKQHDPEGLSPTERRGLFGELFVLRRLIDLGLSPFDVVTAWKGPTAASHDFQLETGSIEVKSTAAVTPTTIRVNNVKQLDNQGLPALLLVLVVLDESQSGGISLPVMIDDIEHQLPSPAKSLWEDSLTSAGYLKIQRDRYELPRYLVRKTRIFSIRDGFPRLLEDDLPDGVTEVSFSVVLTAARAFETGDGELVAMIQGKKNARTD